MTVGVRAAVVAAGLVMALGACDRGDVPAPEAQPAPDAVTAAQPDAAASPAEAAILESQWQCGDQRVAARFDTGAASATLTHDRGQLLLPQAISASGARYADDNGNEFWTKGASGTLTLSGTPARECTQMQPTDVEEAAG